MAEHSEYRPKSFLDRCFRDTNGRVVIAQYPNWPLALWAMASIMQRATPDVRLASGLDLIALAAITYWSGLEIASGVNPFRRALGAMVLAIVLYHRLG